MTLYDYKCKECENIQEEKHSMSETPIITCTKCGSTHTAKYHGNANLRVLFRGVGWAINDAALDKMKVPKHVRENNKDTIMRD